jgi:hypothetical protein
MFGFRFDLIRSHEHGKTRSVIIYILRTSQRWLLKLWSEFWHCVPGFRPEDEDSTFLRNVVILPLKYVWTQPRNCNLNFLSCSFFSSVLFPFSLPVSSFFCFFHRHVFFLMAYVPYFGGIKLKEAYVITLLPVFVSVCVCPSVRVFPVNFWGLCDLLAVCVSPIIIARRHMKSTWRLCIPSNFLFFYAVRVLLKESRRLVLPGTCLFINFLSFTLFLFFFAFFCQDM